MVSSAHRRVFTLYRTTENNIDNADISISGPAGFEP
jgi:hypothetical protein